MTDEEESGLVSWALEELSLENSIWHKNRNTFFRMSDRDRIWWWRAAKKQAELGAPAMQTLLTRVIALRITS